MKRRAFSTFLFFFFFAVLSVAAVYVYHTESFGRCDSHGTTAAVVQAVRFVTAANGAYVIVCVRESMCACHPEHNLDDSNPSFL